MGARPFPPLGAPTGLPIPRYNGLMNMPALAILHEDEALLAVNKPAGVATQAPAGIDSLEVRVRAWLQGQADAAEPVYLGLPHRLDRPVSGVVIMARTRRAARSLSRQFERRRVEKRYWALVSGAVRPDRGQWEDHLRKVRDEPRAEIVASDEPGAQQAVLRYRTLQRLEGATWLEVELVTGRMHQIRLQAASRGHPVLGDAMYGSRLYFGAPHDDARQRSIALHARRLGLQHPATKMPLTLTAPPGSAWSQAGAVEG